MWLDTPVWALTESSILYTDGHMDGRKDTRTDRQADFYSPENICFAGYKDGKKIIAVILFIECWILALLLKSSFPCISGFL